MAEDRATEATGEGPTYGVGDDPELWPTGRLLSTVARRVERAWDAYLEQWSLSHGSVPLLAMLAGGPRSQRELAAQMQVTEQTVSRMVVRLERAGYLRRGLDERDRRRRVVELTAAGAAALEAVGDASAAEALVTAHLDPERLRTLRAILLDVVRSDGGA